MTKILTLDEMREVLATFNPEEADKIRCVLELVGQRMADLICTQFNLVTGKGGCKTEEAELGGTACAFYRKRRDQPTPEPFEWYDRGEPLWVEEDDIVKLKDRITGRTP